MQLLSVFLLLHGVFSIFIKNAAGKRSGKCFLILCEAARVATPTAAAAAPTNNPCPAANKPVPASTPTIFIRSWSILSHSSFAKETCSFNSSANNLALASSNGSSVRACFQTFNRKLRSDSKRPSFLNFNACPNWRLLRNLRGVSWNDFAKGAQTRLSALF